MQTVKITDGKTRFGMGAGREVSSGFQKAPSPGGLAGWLLDLRRWWRERELRERRVEARRQMVVMETLSLGPKTDLLLVSCAGERFLVGTGAAGVQTLVRVGVDRAFGSAPHRNPEDRRLG